MFESQEDVFDTECGHGKILSIDGVNKLISVLFNVVDDIVIFSEIPVVWYNLNGNKIKSKIEFSKYGAIIQNKNYIIDQEITLFSKPVSNYILEQYDFNKQIKEIKNKIGY